MNFSSRVNMFTDHPSVSVSSEKHGANWAYGRSFKMKFFAPNRMSKPVSQDTISCHEAKFTLEH